MKQEDFDGLQMLISEWGGWTDKFLHEIRTYRDSDKSEWKKEWDGDFIEYTRLTEALVKHDISLIPLWKLFEIFETWREDWNGLKLPKKSEIRILANECRSLVLMFGERQDPNNPGNAATAPKITTINAQVEAPAPEIENRTDLWGLRADILLELLEAKALAAHSRVPTKNIVGHLALSSVDSLKIPLSQLKKQGLISTALGCFGGIWITTKGKEKARTIKKDRAKTKKNRTS